MLDDGLKDYYNGWSNRETWAANLHLSNDYRWHTLTMDTVRKAVTGGASRYGVAHLLESCFNDYVEDPEGPLALGGEGHEAAVLRDVGSLWRIDWLEIEPHWTDAVKEEKAYE